VSRWGDVELHSGGDVDAITTTNVDISNLVMSGLHHGVTENKYTMERAQAELDRMFPGRDLSLARYAQTASNSVHPQDLSRIP